MNNIRQYNVNLYDQIIYANASHATNLILRVRDLIDINFDNKKINFISGNDIELCNIPRSKNDFPLNVIIATNILYRIIISNNFDLLLIFEKE